MLLAGQTRLAEELERWIQRQRVSYAHVARFSGVSPNTLSYVRTGSGRRIQQETLRKIAHGLATDPYSQEVDAVVYRAAWTDLAAAAGLPAPVTDAPPITLDALLSEHLRVPGAAAAMAEWIKENPNATADQIRMARRLASALEGDHRRN